MAQAILSSNKEKDKKNKDKNGRNKDKVEKDLLRR